MKQLKYFLSFTVIIAVLSSLVFSFAHLHSVSASDPSLSFRFNNMRRGNKITAVIFADTAGFPIRGINSSFSFPSHLLSVSNISTSDSLCPSFLESYSSKDSILLSCTSSENIIGRGIVAAVTFQAKQSGDARLVFSDDAAFVGASHFDNVLSEKLHTTLRITQDLKIVPEGDNRVLGASTVLASDSTSSNGSSDDVSVTPLYIIGALAICLIAVNVALILLDKNKSSSLSPKKSENKEEEPAKTTE